MCKNVNKKQINGLIFLDGEYIIDKRTICIESPKGRVSDSIAEGGEEKHTGGLGSDKNGKLNLNAEKNSEKVVAFPAYRAGSMACAA